MKITIDKDALIILKAIAREDGESIAHIAGAAIRFYEMFHLYFPEEKKNQILKELRESIEAKHRTQF